jgi:hypothetical protein
MRIGTSLGAFIASSAGLQIEHQKTLRIVKPLGYKVSLNRIVRNVSIDISAQKRFSPSDQSISELDVRLSELFDQIPWYSNQFNVIQSGATRGSQSSRVIQCGKLIAQFVLVEFRKYCNFTKHTNVSVETSRSYVIDHLISHALHPGYLDITQANHEDIVPRFPLFEDGLAGFDTHELDFESQVFDFLWRQSPTDRDPAQVGIQSVSPVGFIEDFAASSVSLKHVQNVAADLDNFGFLDGNYCGGTRIAIQASHLTKDDIFGAPIDF